MAQLIILHVWCVPSESNEQTDSYRHKSSDANWKHTCYTQTKIIELVFVLEIGKFYVENVDTVLWLHLMPHTQLGTMGVVCFLFVSLKKY